MRFKHLSVDFWHTLAEPNRAYTEFRKQTMARYYGATASVAGYAYKVLKNAEETMAVQTGEVRRAESLRILLNDAFASANNSLPLEEDEFALMLAELEHGFLDRPPTLDQRGLETLHRVSCGGPTLSIGSNTNFIIRGSTIAKLLPDIFDFKLFSDELGRCKPCPRFYSAVVLGAGKANPQLEFTEEILHIGDHEVCDVQGALAMGLSAELVTAERPITKLLEQLECEYA